MAGILTEPRPRTPPRQWQPYEPVSIGCEQLGEPWLGPPRAFTDVVQSRRSADAGPVSWAEVGNLLWHVVLPTGLSNLGRAGMAVQRRAAPSAGGLHPIQLVCVGDEPGPARLYDGEKHAFVHLASSAEAHSRNAADVSDLLGRASGCTVRFVADFWKAEAAYTDPETLILRDAGALLATVCFYAEWLGLSARPLGFLGADFVPALGFPSPRFVAVGGLQLTKALASNG